MDISLIADGPHHYHPACGHKGSSHLSLVHALHFFCRDASSALLQLVNQWFEFYLLTFPRFPLRKKEHNPYFGKNRTHDFRTSRCAAYLLDHLGDEWHIEGKSPLPPSTKKLKTRTQQCFSSIMSKTRDCFSVFCERFFDDSTSS